MKSTRPIAMAPQSDSGTPVIGCSRKTNSTKLKTQTGVHRYGSVSTAW